MKYGNVYVVCAMDTEGPIVNPKKPDILQNWSLQIRWWSFKAGNRTGIYSIFKFFNNNY